MPGETKVADVWEIPCPKCGDETCSRKIEHGWFALDLREESEALKVECLACGYDMGLFHPMDHEKAGERIHE